MRKRNNNNLKIVESAMSLIAKRGYKGTTMRQIAKKANLTTGSIYYCFKSKTEILLEIQKNVIDDLVDSLENFPEKFSALEKIENLIVNIMKTINDKKQPYKIMVDEFNHFPPYLQKQVNIKAKKLEDSFKKIIEEGAREGDFKKPDVIPLEIYCKILTFFLLGACNYADRWFDPKGELSYEEIGKLLSSSFLNGLCSDKSKRK